jgi:hypothetical protein
MPLAKPASPSGAGSAIPESGEAVVAGDSSLTLNVVLLSKD